MFPNFQSLQGGPCGRSGIDYDVMECRVRMCSELYILCQQKSNTQPHEPPCNREKKSKEGSQARGERHFAPKKLALSTLNFRRESKIIWPFSVAHSEISALSRAFLEHNVNQP